MVTDEVWQQAGAPDAFLCIECLEDRLDRGLEPADFPRLPLNDDDEKDSVRLRVAKGSGRRAEELYRTGADAVLGAGVAVADMADRLAIDADLLGVWVDNARFSREIAAEIEEES